jgi:hypothetical protein
VLVTNLADGWNSLSDNIAKEHDEFQMQIISTRTEAQYPKNSLEVWRHGLSVRKIMAMRDSDDWIFFQGGAPEDYENQSFYARSMKKNDWTEIY